MSAITIPHLVATETSKQLVVHGKPFLMLPAELQNSSMTCAEHMSTVWQNLVDANVNTVLGSVTWEMIEPVEGLYNFEELDKVIFDARRHNLHLVLLWFGSYKNGSFIDASSSPSATRLLTHPCRCLYICSPLG